MGGAVGVVCWLGRVGVEMGGGAMRGVPGAVGVGRRGGLGIGAQRVGVGWVEGCGGLGGWGAWREGWGRGGEGGRGEVGGG